MASKSLQEQKASKCVHFNGIQNETCRASVSYDVFRQKTPKGPNWIPCFKENECIQCDKRRFPTLEEVEAACKLLDENMARTLSGLAAVSKDARLRKLGKGHGGLGDVKCPICENGTIHYSVASYNGHIHASCTTEDCVSFMQ